MAWIANDCDSGHKLEIVREFFSFLSPQNETAEPVFHTAPSFSRFFFITDCFTARFTFLHFFTSQHKFVLPYRVTEPIMGGCRSYLVGFSTKKMHFLHQIWHWLHLPANVPGKKNSLHGESFEEESHNDGYKMIISVLD